MTRLIDADALKERIITPRANGKDLITELIDSMPTIDAVLLDGSFLKMSKGDYLIYNRHWLYEHFDQEIDIQRSVMKSMGYEPALKDTEPRWIPCSEQLPENMEPVNITWVNRDPEPYYMNIKDKPFTATGIYFKGKWYWYSVTCKDMLGEYGENEIDEVADGIEIVAWMPLPKPYEVNHE
jgi:hypothetical protein